ncbi:hypothetical protein JKF63_05778 [Porcisia hertigi]|uniref:Protein kinase domain-containing protein n=1 Tax=Porcisia hertigi TaxID=2761500 RepID=A0A836IJP5_9TRYP|nr:hypothetical protein JKF63_05778 [Porcisia hertigi]
MNARCRQMPSGSSNSSAGIGGLSSLAQDANSASAATGTTSTTVALHGRSGNYNGGGVEIPSAGWSLDFHMPSSSLGLIQSGLFLSIGEGHTPPASPMDAPMTPQSFSRMFLARESGEGAHHSPHAGCATLLATTVTNDRRSSSSEPRQAPRQHIPKRPPDVSGAVDDAWSGAEVVTNGVEEWCVDGGSRVSHGTGVIGTSVVSGIDLHPPGLLEDCGSSRLISSGRHMTPLSGVQLISGSNHSQIPLSGVDVDEIPRTPTILSSSPIPSHLLSEQQRCHGHGCVHRNSGRAGRGNSHAVWETGVVETDTLVLARAVSKDGARSYEVVNEKYVVYDYVLGKGSYSTVRLAYNLVDRRFYAVKVLDCVRLKRRQLGCEASLWKIDQEIAIMKHVRHKNIIALHEVIRDPRMRYVYLVLELAESREILTMLDSGDVLPRDDGDAGMHYSEETTREVVKGLLHALMYTHYLGVAHRDVKPSNVLRTADGTVKLCDFGVATLVGEAPMRMSREGSVAFLAPELLRCSEVEVSSYSTAAHSFLSGTRERSAGNTLAGATGPERASATSAIAATSVTLLECMDRPISHVRGEGDAQSLPSLTLSLTAGAAEESAHAAATHEKPQKNAGLTASAHDRFPTPLLLVSQPQRGGCKDALLRCEAAAASDSGATTVPQRGASSLDVVRKQVDLFKADVFALGVTVYTMLLGQLPWRASSAASQRAAILAEPDPFLRLYRATYGDAYTWPAKVREACTLSCGALRGEGRPLSSCEKALANESADAGRANAQCNEKRRPSALGGSDVVTAAPGVALPSERRQSSGTGMGRAVCTWEEEEEYTLADMRLPDIANPYYDATTRNERDSTQPVSDGDAVAAVAPRRAYQVSAATAANNESHVSSVVTESRSEGDASGMPSEECSLGLASPRQALNSFPTKESMGSPFRAATEKKTATVEVATGQHAPVTATHLRAGGVEPVEGDQHSGNAATKGLCSYMSTSTVVSTTTAAQSQSQSSALEVAPHPAALPLGQYTLEGTWGPAVNDASGPRPRTPPTAPGPWTSFASVGSSEDEHWLKSKEPGGADSVMESAMSLEQWTQRSYCGVTRAAPCAVMSATPQPAGTGTWRNVPDTTCHDNDVDEGSGQSTESVSCSSDTSTASSLASDADDDIEDNEDVDSCESIYERLFELEQPCRAYIVTEHTPLPAVPGRSGEISGTAVDFVRACLSPDPTERRTVFELFRHPWIRGGEEATPVVKHNTHTPSSLPPSLPPP